MKLELLSNMFDETRQEAHGNFDDQYDLKRAVKSRLVMFLFWYESHLIGYRYQISADFGAKYIPLLACTGG